MCTTRFRGILFAILAAAVFMYGCTANGHDASLQEALEKYVADKDANIGIAVITDRGDTISINGECPYPMLSVYKFPIALTLAEHYRLNNLSPDDSIAISREDLHADTYSPMTEKIIGGIHTDSIRLAAGELLEYMLQLSDNNASDIIMKQAGGASVVQGYLAHLGIKGVNVRNTENEMHIDNSLCYANSATPIGMASLMDKFDREFHDTISIRIKEMMESCETGQARLAHPLGDATIGHKTGTGFVLPDGRLMAVNDAGYIHLPDGTRYAIAVFIENSGYDMAHTEALIGEISRIVHSALSR